MRFNDNPVQGKKWTVAQWEQFKLQRWFDRREMTQAEQRARDGMEYANGKKSALTNVGRAY